MSRTCICTSCRWRTRAISTTTGSERTSPTRSSTRLALGSSPRCRRTDRSELFAEIGTDRFDLPRLEVVVFGRGGEGRAGGHQGVYGLPDREPDECLGATRVPQRVDLDESGL